MVLVGVGVGRGLGEALLGVEVGVGVGVEVAVGVTVGDGATLGLVPAGGGVVVPGVQPVTAPTAAAADTIKNLRREVINADSGQADQTTARASA